MSLYCCNWNKLNLYVRWMIIEVILDFLWFTKHMKNPCYNSFNPIIGCFGKSSKSEKIIRSYPPLETHQKLSTIERLTLELFPSNHMNTTTQHKYDFPYFWLTWSLYSIQWTRDACCDGNEDGRRVYDRCFRCWGGERE